MQDEITIWRLIIATLKDWKSSDIWEKTYLTKILFRKKLIIDLVKKGKFQVCIASWLLYIVPVCLTMQVTVHVQLW